MPQEAGGTPPFLPQGGDSAAQLLQQILKMTTPPSGGGTGPVGVPGAAVPPPQPNIRFDPSGAPQGGIQTAGPRPSMPVPPTGSQGRGPFTSRGEARNAGLTSLGNSLSGIFAAAEGKEHAKKAAMAENYLMQINSLLQSGDPGDRKKAEMFLEDPKIRKILKTGLDFVPLEEKVPPEAEGVQTAVQKIAQKQGQPPVPPQPQQPQMRPVLPQASTHQQLTQAMESALLQKIRQDPAAAISMMGGSQLSAAEQRAAEFYKSGLGLSPVQVASMNAEEKLAGLKVLEGSMRDILRMQTEIYKSDKTYKGRIDSASIMAGARKYAADKYAEAAKGRKGAAINLAAGAKIYEDMAKKYLDLSKQPDISKEQKAGYEAQAENYNRQANDYLNKISDDELMNDFMGAIEGGEEPE